MVGPWIENFSFSLDDIDQGQLRGGCGWSYLLVLRMTVKNIEGWKRCKRLLLINEPLVKPRFYSPYPPPPFKNQFEFFQDCKSSAVKYTIYLRLKTERVLQLTFFYMKLVHLHMIRFSSKLLSEIKRNEVCCITSGFIRSFLNTLTMCLIFINPFLFQNLQILKLNFCEAHAPDHCWGTTFI